MGAVTTGVTESGGYKYTMQTTIERFVQRHLSQEGVNHRVSDVSAQADARRPINRLAAGVGLSRKARFAVFGYSAIVFMCGVALGYVVRDDPVPTSSAAVIHSEYGAERLRIDYDLRYR